MSLMSSLKSGKIMIQMLLVGLHLKAWFSSCMSYLHHWEVKTSSWSKILQMIMNKIKASDSKKDILYTMPKES